MRDRADVGVEGVQPRRAEGGGRGDGVGARAGGGRAAAGSRRPRPRPARRRRRGGGLHGRRRVARRRARPARGEPDAARRARRARAAGRRVDAATGELPRVARRRGLGLGDDPAARFLARGRVALSPGLDYGSAGAGFVRLNFGTSPEHVPSWCGGWPARSAGLDRVVAEAVAQERERALPLCVEVVGEAGRRSRCRAGTGEVDQRAVDGHQRTGRDPGAQVAGIRARLLRDELCERIRVPRATDLPLACEQRRARRDDPRRRLDALAEVAARALERAAEHEARERVEHDDFKN